MTNTTRAPRPHRTGRKHSQTRRQAAASTAPERQEPQRTENVEKMAAVYASAVEQRELDEMFAATQQGIIDRMLSLGATELSNRELEMLDPHLHVSFLPDDFGVSA